MSLVGNVGIWVEIVGDDDGNATNANIQLLDNVLLLRSTSTQ